MSSYIQETEQKKNKKNTQAGGTSSPERPAGQKFIDNRQSSADITSQQEAMHEGSVTQKIADNRAAQNGGTALFPVVQKVPLQPTTIIRKKGQKTVSNENGEPFSLNLLGSTFAYGNGEFTSQSLKSPSEKGDPFNATHDSVKSNYPNSSVSQNIGSTDTNWKLNLAKNVLQWTPLLNLKLPGGSMTVGFDMGVKELVLEADKGESVKTKATLGFKGEGAASTSVEAGSNNKIVDVQVRGNLKGAAALDMGDIVTTLTINLKKDSEAAGRSVKGYSFELNATPDLNMSMEGSLSLRTAYLLQKLKQDWVVLYVKGLYFGAKGGIKGSIGAEGINTLPDFSLSANEAWTFTTKGSFDTKKDDNPLEETEIPGALKNASGMFEKANALFGEGKGKKEDKEKTDKKAGGLKGLKDVAGELDKSFTEKEESTGFLATAWSYIGKSAKQTALTTLKDTLADNKNGELSKYTEKVTKSIQGKKIRLGKYLQICVEELSLDPEKGITFMVRQSVDLFGSQFTSAGTVELQYDLFHQHAYHFQYDLQGKSLLPELAPLWRMHTAGMTMTAAGQKLTLKGMTLTEDELLIQDGQLSIALPKAMGGMTFMLMAKGLRFGESVSWNIIGGQTTSPINLFGQKSLVVKKLIIGSGNHEDGSKGILFATGEFEIDIFKKKIIPSLSLAWDIDKHQFVGTLSDVDLAGVRIDELFVSDRGFHIQTLNIALKDLFDALPSSKILPKPDLEIKVTGFKISSQGVEITSAMAEIPQISMGPLTMTNGSLEVEMPGGKPKTFLVSGNVTVKLWDAEAALGGTLVFNGAEFDHTRSNVLGNLNLGAVKVAVSNIELLNEGGIQLENPSLTLEPGKLGQISSINTYIPNWLLNAMENTTLLIEANSFNTKTGKFEKPRFIPLSLPIPMGSDKFAHFRYDPEEKIAKLSIPSMKREWKPGVTLNVPLLHGVAGLEIGGSMVFGAGLPQEAVLEVKYDTSGENQNLIINNEIEFMLSAGAEIRIGIYAGMPQIITISGGVYGKGNWENLAKLHAGGNIPLGDSDWWLNFNVMASSTIKGEAGAFVSYTIFGQTNRKMMPLAEKELAKWTLLGDVTIGKGDKLTPPSFKINGNETLKNKGEESEKTLMGQIDRAKKKKDDYGSEIDTRIGKIGETEKLLDAVKNSSENVDKLMKQNREEFDKKIKNEEKAKQPNLQRIEALKEQRKVWETFSPGKLQLTGSKEERITNNLNRRKRDLYHTTMKLIKLHVVDESIIKESIKEQRDIAEDVFNDLRKELAANKIKPEAKKSVEEQIVSYQALIARLTELEKKPLPKNAWEQIEDLHATRLREAVKENPKLLKGAEENYQEAVKQHEEAVNSIKNIALERQKFRQQIGAENIQTEEQLVYVIKYMELDHKKWYGERRTFWRKLTGKTADSKVDEAMKKLRTAELELEFADQQRQYTEKLASQE